MDALVQQFIEDVTQDPQRLLDNVLVIDENLRTISVPPKAIIAGAVGDKDINWVNFKIPRYYDGTDLSEFQIRVNYLNANGDPNFYSAQNIVIKENEIYFSWLITLDAVAYPGEVQFSVCLIKYENDKVGQEFTTAISTLEIPDSVKVEQYIDPGEMEDIIARVLAEVAEFIAIKEEEIDEYIADALEEAKEELLDFNNVHQNTKAAWDSDPTFIGLKDHFYYYTDIPALKVGDGIVPLIDKAFVSDDIRIALEAHAENERVHITDEERQTWNNKVSLKIDSSHPHRLIFETTTV